MKHPTKENVLSVSLVMYYYVFGKVAKEYIKSLFGTFRLRWLLKPVSRIDRKTKMMSRIHHRATVCLFPEKLPTSSRKLPHKPNLTLPDLYHPPDGTSPPDSVRNASFFSSSLAFCHVVSTIRRFSRHMSRMNEALTDVAAVSFISAIPSFMCPQLEQPSIARNQEVGR